MASALDRELAPSTLDRVAQALWLAGRVDEKPWDVAAAISGALAAEADDRKLSTGSARPRRAQLVELNDVANRLSAAYLARGAPDHIRPSLEKLAGSIDNSLFEALPRVSPDQVSAPVRAVLYDPSALFGPVRPGRGRLAENQHRAFAKALYDYGDAVAQEIDQDMWEARRRLVDVLARNLRSTNTLARLVGRSDTSTGRLEVIVERLTSPFGAPRLGSGESLLQRFSSFTTSAMTLSTTNRRRLLDEMLKERVRGTVELVTGGGGRRRDLSFGAFNSPFTPDVLVCTQVGDQGIDLHEFCRVVVHYDLTFNPARLEQRTGRCDRIGSRAAREGSKIIVVLPLLAGSYDERIYTSLLQRDQTNEALIGDLSLVSEAVLGDGQPEADVDGPTPFLVSLPPALFERLRPDFSVGTVEGS